MSQFASSTSSANRQRVPPAPADQSVNVPQPQRQVVTVHEPPVHPAAFGTDRGPPGHVLFKGGPEVQQLYGGLLPTAEYFNDVQYLPMNADFYMPPGNGLPYMDPYGIMNPAAFPPFVISQHAFRGTEAKRATRRG